MMVSNFTPDDGYTEKGFIVAVPGLHGDLRFTFRPLLVEERGKVLDEWDKLAGAARELLAAKTIDKQLVSWDLQSDSGKPVEKKVDTVRRLKAGIFYRLWGIVLGTEATDIDPRWDESTQLETLDEQAKAVTLPAPVGTVREAAAEKN